MPTCTYCNANVSPNAQTCPSCGDNLEDMREGERAQEYADFILVIVGMLFLAFGVYLVYSFGGFWGILVGVVSGLIGLFFMYAPQLAKK